VTYTLDSSHLDFYPDPSEDERQRVRRHCIEQGKDRDEMLMFLDALDLIPEACYVGHGSRRSWCAHCRKKWPLPTAAPEQSS
jgi:hypothetical protein